MLRNIAGLGIIVIAILAFYQIASLAPAVVATQPELAGTPSAHLTPSFGLNAVGDYENGYFEVSLSPGERSVLSANVINNGQVDVELMMYAADVVHPPNGGFSVAEFGSTPTGSTTWVDVDSSTFILPAGQTRLVEFTVEVPTDALAGEYVTSLIASTSEALEIEGSDNLKQILRGSVPLVIQIPGNQVASFSLGEPTAERAEDSVILSIPVVNEGNVRVRPEGLLTLVDSNGVELVNVDVSMQSVYAGNQSHILVMLPAQVASGEFFLSTELIDPDSGVTSSLENSPVAISEPSEPATLFVARSSIEPNSEVISFANIDLVLVNDGSQIDAVSVTLNVYLDGELVDEFPLASNQVMISGENAFATRYVPAETWTQGNYTFGVSVLAVDPNGGQQVDLLNEELDAEIVVP